MIARGYLPGAIGRVAELHGAYYHAHWNFGLYFEAKVARELAGFLERYDERRDGFWTASVNGRVQGSITIDAHAAEVEGAHLRWFIVSDEVRGAGVGRVLLDTAVGFCRKSGYARVCLWTFEGLVAARRLYERVGFALAEEREGHTWGSAVKEQRFVLDLQRMP